MAELMVRRARHEDAYALWIWANDDLTRMASFDRARVGWVEHVGWLAERLTDPRHVILIAQDHVACPVGYIRFDTEDDWKTARLSYVVAPESRGRGLAKALVSAGVNAFLQIHSGTLIKADVMPANVRSSRVFRSAGWHEEARNEDRLRFWWPSDRHLNG